MYEFSLWCLWQGHRISYGINKDQDFNNMLHKNNKTTEQNSTSKHIYETILAVRFLFLSLNERHRGVPNSTELLLFFK